MGFSSLLRIQLRVVYINQIVVNQAVLQLENVGEWHAELTAVVACIRDGSPANHNLGKCPGFSEIVPDRVDASKKAGYDIANGWFIPHWFCIAEDEDCVVCQETGEGVCVEGVERVKEGRHPGWCIHRHMIVLRAIVCGLVTAVSRAELCRFSAG